jgi:hypothetical protein
MARSYWRVLAYRPRCLHHPLDQFSLIFKTYSMYYHNLLLALYEPLLDSEVDQEPSPQQIVADAGRYLQTLVRIYYLRHGFDAMDLFVVVPIMFVGFKCVEAIDKQQPGPKLEALRSMLILVATGLYSQRRNHYLGEALFQVIRGRMRPLEAGILRRTLNIDKTEEEKQTLVQAVRSHWPVSIIKEQKDPDSDLLKNLVSNYAHMNIEDNTDSPGGSQ